MICVVDSQRIARPSHLGEQIVTLTFFEVEDRLHLGKTQIKFGFSLDLDNFLTLKNANLFKFSSPNRNFALSLQMNLRERAAPRPFKRA